MVHQPPHCDVKPENVITDAPRSAKLLDFGIARHLLSPTTRGRTGSATAVLASGDRLAGTIGYMAPEQLRGESLDARTDVFQFGAVLYEMLAGQCAFAGDSPLERLAAVLNQDPEFDLLERRQIPADLRKVVACALARDRSNRYVSAAAFLRDLEDVVRGTVVTGLPTIIAIKDFDNATGDPELDWIGSGTAERLSAELARHPRVTVIPREKVGRAAQLLDPHAGGGATDLALGQQVGCAWVVSGAFEVLGAALTVTMRLAEVATGRVGSNERVDGTVKEVCAMQGKLATAAAMALDLTPLATGTGHSYSLEAHESFARARLLLDRLSKASVEQAIEHLERAVTIDPHYVPALAGLAWAYGFRSIVTTDPADLDSAYRFAERAIALDPGNSEAHMWRGYVLLRRHEYDEAARASHRASELAPTNATSPYFAGSALMFGGRSSDALPFLQRSMDLDGKVGMGWLALGSAHLSVQQLPEALYSFTRARDLEGAPVRFPTAGAAAYIAEVLRRQGRFDDARDRSLEGLESAERSDHAYRDFFRAHALVVLGRTALDQNDLPAARAAFRQVLAQAQGRPRTRSCGQLVVQALAGIVRSDYQPELIAEGLRLFDAQEIYNFEPFFGALDEQTLFELAASAHAMDRRDDARMIVARARAVGSLRVLPPD
ncbi:MAG: protein kinase [Acidobacteria bacterium]|nr:protein kinase [Acidobacteriota bacterium]